MLHFWSHQNLLLGTSEKTDIEDMQYFSQLEKVSARSCIFLELQRVRMMFGVFSIVPNTNIDGNDLHDCVK